jgi:hypothetical protein
MLVRGSGRPRPAARLVMALAALAFIGAGTDFIVSTTTRGTATGLAGATRGLVGLVILVVFQVLANWFGVVAATAVALIGISNGTYGLLTFGWAGDNPFLDWIVPLSVGVRLDQSLRRRYRPSGIGPTVTLGREGFMKADGIASGWAGCPAGTGRTALGPGG